MDDYTPQLSDPLKALITPIGAQIRARFDETKRERRSVEDRLLKDLRQYKGVYDPDVNIPKGKSRTFRRMTRTKVKAMDSRLTEMLFPANKDRNWDISPTPRPDMAMTPLAQAMLQQKMAQLAQQAQETGEQPRIDEQALIDEIKKDAAEEACSQMREEIDDQLKEIKHRKICKRVIHSGNLYGVGVLKAPLTTIDVRNAWGMDDSGGWSQSAVATMVPYEEDVPVWDWYPDSEARDLEDCEVFHERHVMTRTDFLDLAAKEDEGFDAEVIRQYAKDYIAGDCTLEHWELSVDEMTTDNDTKRSRTTNRYEVIEVWTSLSSSEIATLGVEAEALDLNGENAWVCVWMVGQLVIKIDVSPLPGRDHPYNVYYYDKDESSIWGEGLASIMRHDQIGLNATIRASLDNVASTAGPITEIDVASLAPGESTEIYPNRKFLARGTSKSPYGALRFHQTESRINEFMALTSKFEENIHEDTLPSYMHGDSATGVGRTVGGLSMLMGAANINVKDQVAHFDDGITRPVIESYYHWNMVFNEREDIKGDFTIKARGSSSLVAKEVRAQQLTEITEFVLHPEVKPFCDIRKFVEEVFKVRDLGGEDIVYDEETAGTIAMLTQQLQQAGGQLQQMTAIIDAFKKQAPALYKQLESQMVPE